GGPPPRPHRGGGEGGGGRAPSRAGGGVGGPATTALSRIARTSTTDSSSFSPLAMANLLDELEEPLQQTELSPAAQHGERQQQGDVAERREAPPAREPRREAIDEAEEAAARRDVIARKELAEEAEMRADHCASLDQEDQGGEREQHARDGSGGGAEGDSVDPREDGGDAPLHGGQHVGLRHLDADDLVVLRVGVHLPQIVALA